MISKMLKIMQMIRLLNDAEMLKMMQINQLFNDIKILIK